MIMSLKAASLGLNMVAACHVLLLDVWWNPTTEDQAIDRAHRIGQTRTVNVSRFTVKNTIEDRILALQVQFFRQSGDNLLICLVTYMSKYTFPASHSKGLLQVPFLSTLTFASMSTTWGLSTEHCM